MLDCIIAQSHDCNNAYKKVNKSIRTMLHNFYLQLNKRKVWEICLYPPQNLAQSKSCRISWVNFTECFQTKSGCQPREKALQSNRISSSAAGARLKINRFRS
ncbi:hypothetical protein JYU34_018535 [Plutella xylostella]|uniref:Uncharacterized protein n=1 Tax=Plutella xylostella TaxID=51655 RepID=A0ABQ7PXR9_PLUXY|nr:hypothetical protein JYU34_018535 [Plutella xylostella]